MQRALTSGPVPLAPLLLATVSRALEWHAELLAMLERELAVKHLVMGALFSADHAQHLLAVEHNNQVLFQEHAYGNAESIRSDSSPTCSLAEVLDAAQLQRVRQHSLLAAASPERTSFGALTDTGAHAGPEPAQMSMYLTALSLEAHVDAGRIKYISNACAQMLGTQLSID